MQPPHSRLRGSSGGQEEGRRGDVQEERGRCCSYHFNLEQPPSYAGSATGGMHRLKLKMNTPSWQQWPKVSKKEELTFGAVVKQNKKNGGATPAER